MMFSGINHGSNTVVPTSRVCVSNLRTRSTFKARQLDLPVGLALRLLSDSTLDAVEILEPIPFSSGPYSMGCSRHMTTEFEECKPHAGSYSGTSSNLPHFFHFELPPRRSIAYASCAHIYSHVVSSVDKVGDLRRRQPGPGRPSHSSLQSYEPEPLP